MTISQEGAAFQEKLGEYLESQNEYILASILSKNEQDKLDKMTPHERKKTKNSWNLFGGSGNATNPINRTKQQRINPLILLDNFEKLEKNMVDTKVRYVTVYNEFKKIQRDYIKNMNVLKLRHNNAILGTYKVFFSALINISSTLKKSLISQPEVIKRANTAPPAQPHTKEGLNTPKKGQKPKSEKIKNFEPKIDQQASIKQLGFLISEQIPIFEEKYITFECYSYLRKFELGENLEKITVFKEIDKFRELLARDGESRINCLLIKIFYREIDAFEFLEVSRLIPRSLPTAVRWLFLLLISNPDLCRIEAQDSKKFSELVLMILEGKTPKNQINDQKDI